MKRLLFRALLLVGFIGATIPASRAAEQAPPPEVARQALKLTDGRTFNDWRIVDESPEYVTIRHKGGASKVSKKLLPEPVRSAYPIDKEAAAAQRAADETARKERETKIASERRLEEMARAEHRAHAAEGISQGIAVNPAAGTEAEQRALFVRLSAAAKARASRFFNYEFEPSGTSRIFSINVSIDSEDPEPWAGIPGRYTVNGKGYLQYYSSHGYGTFDHATKEFTVVLETTKFSVKAVDFRLR